MRQARFEPATDGLKIRYATTASLAHILHDYCQRARNHYHSTMISFLPKIRTSTMAGGLGTVLYLSLRSI